MKPYLNIVLDWRGVVEIKSAVAYSAGGSALFCVPTYEGGILIIFGN